MVSRVKNFSHKGMGKKGGGKKKKKAPSYHHSYTYALEGKKRETDEGRASFELWGGGGWENCSFFLRWGEKRGKSRDGSLTKEKGGKDTATTICH